MTLVRYWWYYKSIWAQNFVRLNSASLQLKIRLCCHWTERWNPRELDGKRIISASSFYNWNPYLHSNVTIEISKSFTKLRKNPCGKILASFTVWFKFFLNNSEKNFEICQVFVFTRFEIFHYKIFISISELLRIRNLAFCQISNLNSSPIHLDISIN